jgi:hypothetical protein
MRDELLAGEIFYSLKEAQVLIEMWRQHYNTLRPHNLLDFNPPVPTAVLVLGLTICRSEYLNLWYNFRGQDTWKKACIRVNI